MPLGMSFYTFQTMSYVIDVYYKKYKPEQNIFKFALFVSFFPQLLQGPIGRYDRLSSQLINGNSFDITNIEHGAQRMLYGMAKKLILADRAYVVAGTIFDKLGVYTGAHIVVALLFYSVYIYCDFAGGMDLVIGAAEIFGVKLDENFRQPYFSTSIGEFWRRWHISLGTWMKDYVFYPFSISKPMSKFGKFAKKKFGKQTGRVLPICFANLLIFFIVGVWHGANWKYIVYGLYNGVIIAVSNLLKPLYAKALGACHINGDSWYWRGFKMFRTFVLVNIGWLCDACSSLSEVFKAIGNTFVGFRISAVFDGGLLKMGLNMRDYKVFFVALVIHIIISILKERGVNLREWIDKRPLVLRWAVYIALVFVTAPFGYVGTTTEFMYAQF
jgi:D-alanyl-lipoteichoic acid acyltransferase DltB (MBOAT superfamily)